MTSESCPVVDAHVHVFPPEIIRNKERYLAKDRWFSELYRSPKARMATWEDVLTSMDGAGIARSVVFGFAWADPALCKDHNDYVIEAVRASAGRLVGLAVVSPDQPGSAAELERCLGLGLVGVGELYPDGQAFDVASSPGLMELAEVLRGWDGVMLVHSSEPVGHAYPGKGRTTPDKLYAMALALPDVRIVLAHWGGGLPFYELMPEAKEALRNVYYDTAATTYLYTFDVFPRVADIVGPQKILFGSDYPLLDQSRLLRRVRASGLQAEELRAILGANAQRVFRTRRRG